MGKHTQTRSQRFSQTQSNEAQLRNATVNGTAPVVPAAAPNASDAAVIAMLAPYIATLCPAQYLSHKQTGDNSCLGGFDSNSITVAVSCARPDQAVQTVNVCRTVDVLPVPYGGQPASSCAMRHISILFSDAKYYHG